MMAMLTKEEFEERHGKNQRISGYGLDVKMHMPCPFCAAADFLVVPILPGAFHEAMTKGGECKECGRGWRAIITEKGPSTFMRFEQTKGDDPPPYIFWIPRSKAS